MHFFYELDQFLNKPKKVPALRKCRLPLLQIEHKPERAFLEFHVPCFSFTVSEFQSHVKWFILFARVKKIFVFLLNLKQVRALVLFWRRRVFLKRKLKFAFSSLVTASQFLRTRIISCVQILNNCNT